MQVPEDAVLPMRLLDGAAVSCCSSCDKLGGYLVSSWACPVLEPAHALQATLHSEFPIESSEPTWCSIDPVLDGTALGEGRFLLETTPVASEPCSWQLPRTAQPRYNRNLEVLSVAPLLALTGVFWKPSET